jgi:cephalosporin hydroxylase
MELRDTPSDFNEHMPVLRDYAAQVKHVTEFGVGRSSWALLHARPERLRCYDLGDFRRAAMQELVTLGKASGVDVDFMVGNSIEIEIEPTDLLFIDSLHTYAHLSRELKCHAVKVSRYIVLHDTETFGAQGEDGTQPGLSGAVEDFLASNTEWKMRDRLKNNNGLTILERCGGVAADQEEDLFKIFVKYGTDKHINRYAPLYYAILRDRREHVRSLLEVGIGTMIPGVHSSMVGYAQDGYAPGGSLRAWRDYLPNATITGMDVQPDTQVTGERIETLLCDSTDEARVRAVLGNRQFDVVIDDGSHADTDQLATLRHLYPRVNPGGLYVIEDICRGSRLTTSPFDIVRIIGHDGLFFAGREANACVICAPVNGRQAFPIMNTNY